MKLSAQAAAAELERMTNKYNIARQDEQNLAEWMDKVTLAASPCGGSIEKVRAVLCEGWIAPHGDPERAEWPCACDCGLKKDG